MRYRWPFMAILGVSLLATPLVRSVRADEGSGPEKKGWFKGHGKHEDGLGLSEDQKSKLNKLEEDQRAAMKPVHRKMRDLTIKLKDQIEDKAADSEIKATLEELHASRKAMMEQMQKFEHEKDSILTPTQEAKMMLWHMHPMHRGEFMGEGEEHHHHEGFEHDHMGPPDGDGPHGHSDEDGSDSPR